MSRRGRAPARAGRRRVSMVAAGAAMCMVLALPAIALAANAADLEAKVREDAARANQFGKASAGTAPPAATGSTPTGAPGEICLLGVCTYGAPKRADAVPGWFVLDQRSFALAMLRDFVNAGNCLDANQTRKELAAMPPPRNADERQQQEKRRADLNKKLQETAQGLQGVDCSKYTLW